MYRPAYRAYFQRCRPQPWRRWSSYCATKAALDHHARAVALEHLPGLRIASLAPGVADTTMQAEIRAGSVAQFPQKERFEALHTGGQLASPAVAAGRLVDYLLGERFGDVADGDLRHLGPAERRMPSGI